MNGKLEQLSNTDKEGKYYCILLYSKYFFKGSVKAIKHLL